MGVSFVYGPACSGKSTDLYHKILSEAEKKKKKKYIFVVPEQFALSVEKELIGRLAMHILAERMHASRSLFGEEHASSYLRITSSAKLIERESVI